MNAWIEANCWKCKAKNFVNLGNLNDLSLPDVEGFHCYNCQFVSGLDESTGEGIEISKEEADEIHLVNGRLTVS